MKLGSFIGKDWIQFTKENIDALTSVITDACKENFDGSLKVIQPDEDNAMHTLKIEWTLKNPIRKRMVKAYDAAGDYVYNITKLTFLAWAETGYLENDPNKTQLMSFSVKAYTDGKYHMYRHHKDHDFQFEGTGHYMYNTNFADADFIQDFNFWVNNIATKCAA